jgi:hypothetical protein
MNTSLTAKLSDSKRKNRLRLITGLGLALLSPACLLAKDYPVLKVDLNGDGTLEKIEPKKTSTNDAGDFYQLVVGDTAKKIKWSSPVTKDTNHEFAFGNWNHGESMPQIAGDIDGDGAIELVVPAARSDVSPPSFRIFRWEKQSFVFKFSKALSGPGKEGGKVSWTATPRNTDFWVEEWIKKNDKGGWVVRMVSHDWESDKAPKEGTAELMPKDSSFLLVKWLKAPAVVKEAP